MAILSDAFFLMLARPARRKRRSGARAARTACQGFGDDLPRADRGGAGEGGRELGDGWESPLAVLLDGSWFTSVIEDAPRRSREPLFREEAVAALAAACTQVRLGGAGGQLRRLGTRVIHVVVRVVAG